MVSDPTITSGGGGKCQRWYVVKPGDLSSPYFAADCQQLCSQSASCGATTFTSQGSTTYLTLTLTLTLTPNPNPHPTSTPTPNPNPKQTPTRTATCTSSKFSIARLSSGLGS